MVLNALKHRARIVTPLRTSERVEGTTTVDGGPEFRCYLGRTDPIGETSGNGRIKVAERVNLIYWPLAIDGSEIEVGVSDELEISTGDGASRWRVRAQPLAVSAHGRRRAVVTTVERVFEA